MEINNVVKANKLSIYEFKESLPPVLSIILGVLVSIPFGFILANTLRLYNSLIGYVSYIDYYIILLYIFCNIFFGLILGIAISYGIKRHKYKNKKNLFILIVSCSFLIYFFFHIIFTYILFRTGYLTYVILAGLDDTYHISFIQFLLITLGTWPLMYLEPSWPHPFNVMWDIIEYIKAILMITPGNRYITEALISAVNSLFWFTQFLITIFCTWKFIIFTCPWLSPMAHSDMEKKSWYASLIKAMRRRTM